MFNVILNTRSLNYEMLLSERNKKYHHPEVLQLKLDVKQG